MKFQILICSLEKRRPLLDRLLKILIPQCGCMVSNTIIEKSTFLITDIIFDEIGISIMTDNGENSIGYKRNYLLNYAKGDYLCWTDDDDILSDNYITLIMEGINSGVDSCSLTGIITEDGLNPKRFIHSIRFDSWFEKDNIYYRNTNHLNCVKSSIAKQMIFPEKNHGEDRSYSEQLLKSGLIKSEHWIEQPIYFYEYRSNK